MKFRFIKSHWTSSSMRAWTADLTLISKLHVYYDFISYIFWLEHFLSLCCAKLDNVSHWKLVELFENMNYIGKINEFS